MNLPDFRSSLADPLRQFLQFKQALNRKYRTEGVALRLFDGYLCEHSVADWKAIDSAMIDDFLKSRPRTRPRSYNHLLGVLHRFFAFAIMQQWARQNPVTGRPRRNTGNRIPYLFDLRDAKRLLAVARGLPDKPRAPLRGLVYEMVFALLYGLGMRVGEVARLKLGDADLICNTLFIRDTKFSKSRIVPMGCSSNRRICCRSPSSRSIWPRSASPTVDGLRCMRVRTNRYSVPLRPGTKIEARVKAHSVELWHEGKRIARHERCYSRQQQVLDLEHYLDVLEREPGALGRFDSSGPVAPGWAPA
jgi:hypothetical protein